MPQAHALRLAQLHNREDSVHHCLTTRDKVRWERTKTKKFKCPQNLNYYNFVS